MFDFFFSFGSNMARKIAAQAFPLVVEPTQAARRLGATKFVGSWPFGISKSMTGLCLGRFGQEFEMLVWDFYVEFGQIFLKRVGIQVFGRDFYVEFGRQRIKHAPSVSKPTDAGRMDAGFFHMAVKSPQVALNFFFDKMTNPASNEKNPMTCTEKKRIKANFAKSQGISYFEIIMIVVETGYGSMGGKKPLK